MMLAFLIGTACLFGLVRWLHAGRCGGGRAMQGACAYGGGGHGVFGDHGGWRGRCGPGGCGGPRGCGYGGGRADCAPQGFLRTLFERLRTTPGQERVIGEAVEELLEGLREARRKLGGLRDVASALRAESFDEGAAARAGIDAEEAFKAAREAVLAALRKIHEALDPRQRAVLADLLEARGRGFPFGGPYRSDWV
jgi:uncharacterized membrane protein